MLINRLLVLQRCIIRQMFILTPLTHRKPYAANGKILFIKDLLNYLLYQLAYKIYRKLPLPHNIACLFIKPCTYVTHGSDIKFFSINSVREIRRYSLLLREQMSINRCLHACLI